MQGEGIRVWQRPEFHVWLSAGKKRLPLGGLPPVSVAAAELGLTSSEKFWRLSDCSRTISVAKCLHKHHLCRVGGNRQENELLHLYIFSPFFYSGRRWFGRLMTQIYILLQQDTAWRLTQTPFYTVCSFVFFIWCYFNFAPSVSYLPVLSDFILLFNLKRNNWIYLYVQTYVSFSDTGVCDDSCRRRVYLERRLQHAQMGWRTNSTPLLRTCRM